MIQWAWDMLFFSQEALLGALMEVGAAAGFCKWGFPPLCALGNKMAQNTHESEIPTWDGDSNPFERFATACKWCYYRTMKGTLLWPGCGTI